MHTLCSVQKLKLRLYITAEIASTNYRKHRVREHKRISTFYMKAARHLYVRTNK